MKRPAIIVDLDETLADTRHRMHVVTGRDYLPEDYDKYYKNHEQDPVYPHVRDLIQRYIHTHKIFFMTGRPEKHRQTTHTWIWQKTGMIPDPLLMRPEGVWDCDTQVKTALYEAHVKDKYHVDFALEDRTKVVKMWRDLGIPCFQVQQSDY